jgi:hypothetical protein
LIIGNTAAPTGWTTSSFSNGNANCVQVRFARQGGIQVRDSKDRRAGSPTLGVPSAGWTALLKDITA